MGKHHTGFLKTYAEMDFNPQQETLVLSAETYTKADIARIQRTNYIRVEVTLWQTTNVTSGDVYAEFFYFVDKSEFVPPVYQGDPQRVNTASIIASIKMDAWGTYCTPDARPALAAGTVIEQSTPLENATGATTHNRAAATVPLLNPPADRLTGRTFYNVQTFTDFFGNPRGETFPTLPIEDSYYFVGIYALSAEGGVVALCRPYNYYPLDGGAYGADAYASINTLLNVDKLRFCSMTTSGYIALTDNADYDITANLVRAYIIPKRAFQVEQIPTVASPMRIGYRIAHVAGISDNYPFKTALAVVDETKIQQFDTLVYFDVDDAVPKAKKDERPAFVDIGTPFTRLEIPAPTDTETPPRVEFTGQVTSAGYSLIMRAGARQVDIGGDFEIPVPDNAQAEAYSRNKWSLALQGVSHVGNVALAAASKNAIAFVGAS
ncbi:MAG: hypothetical protein IJX18_03500, partial [Clostridia bacterium]|nr:hypothetical protein [Clostridia bacterium]